MSEPHTDEMYVRYHWCMVDCLYRSNSIMHIVNPNDGYKTKCVTIACASMTHSPFECQHATSMNPSRRQQTTSKPSDPQQRLQQRRGTNRKQGSPREDHNCRGSARGLSGGNKQHWSLQNNKKQDCSKGKRQIRDGKLWRLRSKDRKEESKRK